MPVFHRFSETFKPPLAGAALLALLLAACGGGGGGGSGGDGTGLPAPTGLTVAYDVKGYAFAWNAVPGATHYQLLEDPDGPEGAQPAVQLGADLSSTSSRVDHSMRLLHERLNAQYAVRACDATGCGQSASVQPDLTKAIGYVKATNTRAHDAFGTSVAISADGSTLAVGAVHENSAPEEEPAEDRTGPSAGAVYVYTRSAQGAWSRQAFIKPSNPDDQDAFGAVIALSADGNTLAVGAPLEDSNAVLVPNPPPADNDSALNSGAVYVFHRGAAGNWSQQAYVKADNTGAEDHFGSALALSADGRVLAVGASNEDGLVDGSANSGAVYVYARLDTGAWAFQQHLAASNAGPHQYFGRSVALSSDGRVLAAGSLGEAAYVFERDGAGWSERTIVTASNAGSNDSFGKPIALSGDGSTLAVGASSEDGASTGVNGPSNEGAEDSGAVYVFVREGGDWIQQAYVKASNTESLDEFGAAISLSADGSTLAVGAIWESSDAAGIGGAQSSNAAEDSGAVYLFVREGSTWRQVAYVKASNNRAAQTGQRFGSALSLSGDGRSLAVGASREASGATGINGDQTDTSAFDAGAVYLY